jgi:outer membrane protein OmpA-like peptidoglycan-associated protein
MDNFLRHKDNIMPPLVIDSSGGGCGNEQPPANKPLAEEESDNSEADDVPPPPKPQPCEDPAGNGTKKAPKRKNDSELLQYFKKQDEVLASQSQQMLDVMKDFLSEYKKKKE